MPLRSQDQQVCFGFCHGTRDSLVDWVPGKLRADAGATLLERLTKSVRYVSVSLLQFPPDGIVRVDSQMGKALA